MRQLVPKTIDQDAVYDLIAACHLPAQTKQIKPPRIGTVLVTFGRHPSLARVLRPCLGARMHTRRATHPAAQHADPGPPPASRHVLSRCSEASCLEMQVFPFILVCLPHANRCFTSCWLPRSPAQSPANHEASPIIHCPSSHIVSKVPA
jgi:hypothetical protein